MGVLGQGEVQLRALSQFMMTDQLPIWTKIEKQTEEVKKPENRLKQRMMSQRMLDLLSPDEQLRALALLQCDQLEICTRENMKRRKVFRPETEKKLQEEPDTQPEALESEASTEKKHEEEQGTQQRE